MKTILIESFLVVASVLLWLIVLPLAALLSPVLIPLLSRAAQRSPILPPEGINRLAEPSFARAARRPPLRFV
jgi:hypothetical protein